MRTRPGFARLLPLMALTGLAAGTVALLASAQPVQTPAPSWGPEANPGMFVPPHDALAARDDGGCSNVPGSAPARGLVDSAGHPYELADVPGAGVTRLELAPPTGSPGTCALYREVAEEQRLEFLQERLARLQGTNAGHP
jgi:hypothetical protein